MSKFKRIIICGAAGSGKTWLAEQMIGAGYKFPLTYTTRPIREGEKHGKDYWFISGGHFQTLIENDEMYEYVKFNGWMYGRTKEDFYSGNLMIMTPAGIAQMSEQDLNESFIVYLDIDEEIRLERVSERNDADDSLRRVKADNKDFAGFEDFNYRVTTPNFTYAQVQMAIDRFTKMKQWAVVTGVQRGNIN